MTSYFLDSSALVKRYMAEAGARWIEALCTSESDTVAIAEITLAEVAAVFARAVPGRRITEAQRARYLEAFLGHCDDEYQLLPISRAIVDHAVLITQRH
jgi:predicted nucleic acid-binding protein